MKSSFYLNETEDEYLFPGKTRRQRGGATLPISWTNNRDKGGAGMIIFRKNINEIDIINVFECI